MPENSFFKKFKNTVFPETWCCALRTCNTCILDDTTSEFIVLENTKRYWCADPFLFKKNGKYYLFFEAFDRLQRKGLLAYREINGNEFGQIKIIYETESHLSYPFIFEKDDNIYIIPESNKSGELYRLKCVQFPDKWEKEKVIADIKLADTTLFSKDGIDYYLTERVDESNTFDRLDLFYEENGELKECENNPVKLDAESARCAGKVFRYNDFYIRPSQDCGKAYGEKLNFNRIDSISKEAYSEDLIKTVCYSDLCIDKYNRYSGIHTYNKLDNYEVVDLKIKNKFNFYNFIGICRKVFRKVFNR